jgi:hypothetical protein
MSPVVEIIAALHPNPHWARLPLFNRKNWSRLGGNVESEAGD